MHPACYTTSNNLAMVQSVRHVVLLIRNVTAKNTENTLGGNFRFVWEKMCVRELMNGFFFSISLQPFFSEPLIRLRNRNLDRSCGWFDFRFEFFQSLSVILKNRFGFANVCPTVIIIFFAFLLIGFTLHYEVRQISYLILYLVRVSEHFLFWL